VISDAGLPMPPGVGVLDLSLVPGVPTFMQAVQAVMQHLKVDSAVISEEMATANQDVLKALMSEIRGTPVARVPHEQFKMLTRDAKLIVRTGECTPYANIILGAGVTF
jgi:D-ribose pyranase